MFVLSIRQSFTGLSKWLSLDRNHCQNQTSWRRNQRGLESKAHRKYGILLHQIFAWPDKEKTAVRSVTSMVQILRRQQPKGLTPPAAGHPFGPSMSPSQLVISYNWFALCPSREQTIMHKWAHVEKHVPFAHCPWLAY